MKKTAIALLAALSAPAYAADITCEFTDLIYYSNNNVEGIPTAVKPIGKLTGFQDTEGPLTHFDFYLDGVNTGVKLSTFAGFDFSSGDYIYAPAEQEAELSLVIDFEDGSHTTCATTINIPADNAPPVIIQEHLSSIETLEDGSVQVMFNAYNIDTDENLQQSGITYEFIEAPAGVQVPAVGFHNDATIQFSKQELNFTVPGNYKLRLRAEDDMGAVGYSDTFEFTVAGEEGCINSTIENHISAGRAMEISGSYFSTGAYVYLGYQNSGNSVGLELVEELGNWWVVCQ